jgi:hypothetical protein
MKTFIIKTDADLNALVDEIDRLQRLAKKVSRISELENLQSQIDLKLLGLGTVVYQASVDN